MIPLLKIAKMKICGLEKLRVFFSLILMVSLMWNGVNGFTVVRSTAANGAGVPDLFSNPSCRLSDCISFASVCATRDCCSCQCLKTSATYVILPVNRCVAQEYIDEDCSSFYVPPDESPPPVADITKQGYINFSSESRCINGLHVHLWSHSVVAGSWTDEQRNFFTVAPVEGSDFTWRLSWKIGLDAKYSGQIIKVQFSCQSHTRGCFLMKSKGNYTIPNSEQQPSIIPTDVSFNLTGRNARPTVNSGTSARSNRNDQDKVQAPAKKTQAELEPKKTGVVVAGVTVSLAAGFVLALATLLLTKKKQTSIMVTARKRPHSHVGYEEPVDSNGHPRQRPTGSHSFDNEFYTTDCVLSLTGNNMEGKVSRLGPLPPLPGEESIYEEPMIKRIVAYQGLADKNKQQDAGTVSNVSSNVQPQPEYKVIGPASKEDSYGEGTDDDKGGFDQDGADNGAHEEGANDDKGGFDQDGADNGAHEEEANDDKGGFDQDAADNGAHEEGANDDKGRFDQDGADNGAYDEGANDDKGGFDQDAADNGADRVCRGGVIDNNDDDDDGGGQSIAFVKYKNDDYDDVVSKRRESEA